MNKLKLFKKVIITALVFLSILAIKNNTFAFVWKYYTDGRKEVRTYQLADYYYTFYAKYNGTGWYGDSNWENPNIFFYDHYSNGQADLSNTWDGGESAYDRYYTTMKQFDSEAFMNDDNLNYLKGHLGHYATTHPEVGGYGYLVSKDQWNRDKYDGLSAPGINGSSIRYVIMVHPNIWCLDPANTGEWASEKNLKLLNVLDINHDGDKPLNIDLYYKNGATIPYSDKVTKDNGYVAQLAYRYYFCGESEKVDGGEGRRNLVLYWMYLYHTESSEFSNFLKENFPNQITFGYKAEPSWNNSWSWLKDDCTRLRNDSEAYARFVINRDNAGGKTIVQDEKARISKSNATIDGVNGTKFKGIRFTEFVTDTYGYSNPQYYNAGQSTGTSFNTSLEVILNDGTKINTDNGIRLIREDTGAVVTDLRTIQKGIKYSVFIPQEYVGKIQSARFTNSYNLYRGRIAICDSEDVMSQIRGVAGGTRVRQEDTVEIELKSNEVIPEIVINKTDLDGIALEGAEFSAKLEANGKTATLNNLTTNEAGKIVIFSSKMEDLEIEDIKTFTGTIKLTLKETKAPAGYELNSSDIIANITFTEGKVTDIKCEKDYKDVKTTVEKTSYKDEEEKDVETQVAVISVKDVLDSKLKIRKIDGDSDVQKYLGGATFYVTVKNGSKIATVTRTSNADTGYIDITDKAREVVGVLGRYTGTIDVTLKETKNPSGYAPLPELNVSLEYKNGKLINTTYGNDATKVTIDIEKNNGEITLAVKNTKILEYINLVKIDKTSGVGIPNVEFRIKMTSDNEELHSEEYTALTSSDGLIIIDESKLNKVGIAERYTGNLKLVIEEINTPEGYKGLTKPIEMIVEYEEGVIKSSSISKQGGQANLTTATINGINTLEVEVPNERKLPDLVISKKSLTNGGLESITATFNVRVTASGRSREIVKLGQTVNANSEIVITNSELETLGIDGSYTGNINVELEETSVSDEAAKIPEKITVTIAMKDGRFSEATTTNKVHTSVEETKSSIEIIVLDSKNPEQVILKGKVWEELSGSKAHDIEIDGKYNPDESLTQRKDALLKDIEVTLYRKNGDTLEFVNVSKGTNPTFTDDNGEYKFEVSGSGEYVVKFTYNGLKYQNTINNQDAINGSRGRELSGSRAYVNSMFSEIGSYPANYKMQTKLFDSSKITTENNLRSTYEAGYNISYRYDEIEDVYNDVIAEMKSRLEKKQIVMESLVYKSVVDKNLSDKEIYNKLQFIHDSKVNAFAGRYSSANNEYGKCMVNSISDMGTYEGVAVETDEFIADNNENLNINIGLVRRDQTDLQLYKYVSNVVVSVNGHDEKYNHGDKIDTTQYIRETDFNINTQSNSDGTAWYSNDVQMDLYVTYKIRVSNTTLTQTYLTEVVDYYDSRFSFVSARAESNGNEISNITTSDKSKYVTASMIGLNGAGEKYKAIYITFNNNTEVKSGNPVDIYVTLKLNNAKQTLANELLKNTKTLEAFNYAEINGYKTNGGYLDSNSMPGNYKVATESPKENDSWRAKLSIKPDDNTKTMTRTMNGNVWNATNESVITGADLANNDKILTFTPNSGVEGIIVELVELKDGKQTVVARTLTTADGSYSFKEFLPGDYVVRFTYGKEKDDSFTAEQNAIINKASFAYNGARYQSTKANPNTDTDKYWYLSDKDTRYSDAYDDVKSRVDVENQNKTNQEAREYTYKDLIELNSKEVESKIHAYTSTLVFDSEVAMTEVEGGRPNEYVIENVDFGLTPRTVSDLKISKRVSNIKVYLQDGTLQLDADIDEAGTITLKNDPSYRNTIYSVGPSNSRRDGLINAEIDQALLNGSTLEITYTIDLSNKGGKETITYIYGKDSGDTPIAVSYYGEGYETLTSYESDREGGRFVYHDGDSANYSLREYNKDDKVDLLSNTYATQIIDYVDPSLNFITVNRAGAQVNTDWELASANEFVSSRQLNEGLMNKYNTIIKAKDTNRLLTGKPSRGETVSTTLTLSRVLSTSSTETNDMEYSNLIEITKIYSTNIGYLRLQGYDITGEERPETSEYMDISKINLDGKQEGNNIYPTLGTAKSETFVLVQPTGLNTTENILSNTVIVLLAIIVLAGGIVLIKKYVLGNKNQ